MNNPTTTFSYPLSDSRTSKGEVLIVAEKKSGFALIESISYRPNAHTVYSLVTDLVRVLNEKLFRELQNIAWQRFEAGEVDEPADKKYEKQMEQEDYTLKMQEL